MSSTGSSILLTGGPTGSSHSDAGSGFSPAPPPPPPPPPPGAPGQVPAFRINEGTSGRRPLSSNVGNTDRYEPPAAIQNAMMTKDKKPFTYTPGMGGKLDLSQIRSPRMARRVAKNANDEGIEGPPKASPSSAPEVRPVSAAPNLYIQPQVAVPVFPTNPPPPPERSPRVSVNIPANLDFVHPEARVVHQDVKVIQPDIKAKSPPTPPRQNSNPESPTSPQVVLAKAPTPWLQNKIKPQEELPEWAKRSGNSGASVQPQQRRPSPPSSSPPVQQSQPQERIIPLCIEDRPSVFSVKNDHTGHQRYKPQQQSPQPSSHHQQRWGNGSPSSPLGTVQVSPEQYQSPSRPKSTPGGTYIVPIVMEASDDGSRSPRAIVVDRNPMSPRITSQNEPGPVQSKSFRVLQKITDTDQPEDQVDGTQIRKLRLAENDKVLMNKLRERVDGDGVYLHQEEDPRYRGSAIPSRAFRFLQNMTESGDPSSNPSTVGRSSGAINKRQPKDSPALEERRANVPPASEQQVQEPKKYTGSAIPSRSFRILQAMTSPESIAKGECDRRKSLPSPPFANIDTSRQPRTRDEVSRSPRAPSESLDRSSSSASTSSSSSSSSISASSRSSPLTSSSSSSPPSPSPSTRNPISRSPLRQMCDACYRHFRRRPQGHRHRHYHHRHHRHSRNDARDWREKKIALLCHPLNNEFLFASSISAVLLASPDSTRPFSGASSRPEFSSSLLLVSSPLASRLPVSTRRETNEQLGHDENSAACLETGTEPEPPPWPIEEQPRIDDAAWNRIDVPRGSKTTPGSVLMNIPEQEKHSDDLVTNANESREDTDASSSSTSTSSSSPEPEIPIENGSTDSDSSEDQNDSDSYLAYSTIPLEENETRADLETKSESPSPPVKLVIALAESEDETQPSEESLGDVSVQFNISIRAPVGKSNLEYSKLDEKEIRSREVKLKVAEGPETRRGGSSLTISQEESEDDDDSGVTSDTSRFISEVDTDSECGKVARKTRAYQRTQTHSRLFKLLVCSNGDSRPVRNTTKEMKMSNPARESLKIDDIGRHEDTTSGFVKWRFRRPVVCPRIKSCKNVPRTCHEKDRKTRTEADELRGFLLPSATRTY